MSAVRILGVTVMPEYIQSEGVEAVLDALTEMGATSITTSPYVVQQALDGTGAREPPADAGAGLGRLLDRPLWGRREVWLTAAPSFLPTPERYPGPYRPDAVTDLTHSQGPVISAFLAAAKARGMETWMQVMAAAPPGYKVSIGGPTERDMPLMADGQPLPGRVDRNATLASHDLRVYMRGFLADLCAAYPEVDGIRFDWPEYPPYSLQSLCLDYNPQVAHMAARIGLDIDHLGPQVALALPDPIFGRALRDGGTVEGALDDLIARKPVLGDHFTLRRTLTTEYAAFLRDAVDSASNGRSKVFLQGFPPPWGRLSGFDPAAIAPHVDVLAVKFYTMHWPMICADFSRNAAYFGLDEGSVTAILRQQIMGQPTDNTSPFTYPAPLEPHGVAPSVLTARLRETLSMHGVAKGAQWGAVTHGYGPKDDVLERLTALVVAEPDRIEINRFGFLDQAKIAAIGAIMRK